MLTDLSCPCCGSLGVTSTLEPYSIKIPFTEEVNLNITVNFCRECRERGDFAGVNDHLIAEAEDIARKEAVKKILKYLIQKGFSISYIERVFKLPQRTLSNLEEKCGSAEFSLLCIIRTIPWIIEIAESGFEKDGSC